jgi:hypothetical protein
LRPSASRRSPRSPPTSEGLDHYLEDAEARAKMLAESDRFMTEAFKASR